MFNRSQIMKAAHEAAKRQFAQWPFQRQQFTYREMFAACLQDAWRDAHSAARHGAQNAARIASLQGQVLSIKMQSRMCTADFARVRDLEAEISKLAA